MISLYRKIFLIFLTLLLDIGFLYIIINEELNEYDKKYLYNLFLIHIIFIVALIYNIKTIIDVCHCFMFLAIYLCFIIENKSILIILFTSYNEVFCVRINYHYLEKQLTNIINIVYI